MAFKSSKDVALSMRFKGAFYGDPGVGKTLAAIQFPGAAVIDLEKGTVPYSNKFDFDVEYTSDATEVETIVKNLKKNPGKFKTLVIDSISHYGDSVAERRRRYKANLTSTPTYELDLRTDYSVIKRDIKEFVNDLLSLDMNIIVTTREKGIPAKGKIMETIGIQPDMHKVITEMFDTIIYIEIDKDDDSGKRMAYTDATIYHAGKIIVKDRYSLPKKFEFSYENLIKHLDINAISRESVVVPDTDERLNAKRNTVITLDGKVVYTAGITAEQIARLQEADEKAPDRLEKLLKDDYGVPSVLDLRVDEAEELVNQLTNETN